MRHIIITRFGIGQMRSDFFAKKTEYLERVTAVPLRQQSDMDFAWVIVTDKRIPAEFSARLQALSQSMGVQCAIHYHDPFRRYALFPGTEEILNQFDLDHAPTIITRLDDDDAVHPGFCQAVREEADRNGNVFPLCISMAVGAVADPESGEVIRIRYPDYSIQSVATREGSPWAPYAVAHHKLRDSFREHGYECREITTAEPMWLRIERQNSESGRGVSDPRARLQKYLAGTVGEGADGPGIETAVLLRSFGLSPTLMEDLAGIEAGPEQDNFPLLSEGARIKRMAAKRDLLVLAKRLAKAEGRDSRRFASLKAAFYAF